MANIDSIPYNAPLSFKEPSSIWKTWKNHQGATRAWVDDSHYPEVPVAGKWIIISGSNNGIGREAALKFAAWGANVILACRNPPPHEIHPTTVVEECKHEALLSGYKTTIEWWELDCGSIASVEAFAKRWLDTGRTLDILCNNAGMGNSPAGQGKTLYTKDGFEIIHQVNFLSHVLLTLRLLPNIAKSSQPRIVCTCSCFHYAGNCDLEDFNGKKNLGGQEGVQYYMNNKLFFMTFVKELQHRLLQHDQYKHITVQGIHPGYVNSVLWNLGKQAQFGKETAVKILAYFLAITPQQGSLAITHAATALECGPDPAIQGVGQKGGLGGGRYWNRVWEDEPMPHCSDPDYRCRVWRLLNDELKLQEKGLLDVLGVKTQPSKI